ncbi:uncharacterized protein EI90DRAFT_2910914 [Cantharellus anzutake]|uniref:uncharacterized protein n=1 Tax=Cantharellus anzutake TaxID=1750568 RepID=UPI001906EA2B|nr:uncharacterized protein EI90DRAFT_2910914 [Cantharellus anzutake]KAF8336986.1 hypothetical protein EI90DRAFT_2910914 [Cantharellus anzutake]
MVLDRRPPFEVTELPGRGKGLVATHQIKQGQLIMTEKPLFILPNAISSSPTKLLNDVTSQLTPFEHAQYFNLSYPSHVVSSPDEVALSIFMTNAIAAGEDEAGIFPVTARLNHGCSRAFNVVYHWREEKHELVVHALRDIEPGEELLTTYTDTKKPRAVRREYLSQHYHFQCNCAVCSLPDNESQKSDDRLVRYAENRLALSSWASGRIGGVDAIRLVKEIWSIGQEEGYLSERGQLALDAAYVCAAHTDVEAFKAWIRLAIKWTAIELGRDDEKVAGLKALSDRPESHPEWNTRPHLILPLLQ